jgi:hypothetical protein
MGDTVHRLPLKPEGMHHVKGPATAHSNLELCDPTAPATHAPLSLELCDPGGSKYKLSGAKVNTQILEWQQTLISKILIVSSLL